MGVFNLKARKSIRVLLVMTVALVMAAGLTISASAAVKVPAKVAGVTAIKPTTNTVITIKWNKAKNAKQYQVNYKKATAKKWTVVKTKALKITRKGLKANTKYNFKVRGINGKKYGKFSKVLTQTTYATPGKVNIKSIFPKKRTAGNITLQWSKAANASWYEIQPYRLNGKAFRANTSNGTTYANVHETKANTWYGYKIRTVNAKTGKFPAIKSAWTAMYYACTTSGDRVITGVKNKNSNIGLVEYEMTGTTPFRIGEDDALIPTGFVDISDKYTTQIEMDKLYCNAVKFPDDYKDTEVAGNTYTVGDSFKDQSITYIEISYTTNEDRPANKSVVSIICGDDGDIHPYEWD
jgi:hypothetical protein